MLAPAARLLASASTRFPVYAASSVQPAGYGVGSEEASDPVQSGCPSSHYHSGGQIGTYKTGMPVGFNNFKTDGCARGSTDYALYRAAIPRGPFEPHGVLISASFQVLEVYSSSCTVSAPVTASWIGAIGPNSGWPGPNPVPDNSDATTTIAPDHPHSCNRFETKGVTIAAGLDVGRDLQAIRGSASSITLRLWEKGNPSEVEHKQFSDNPDLQVEWTDTPDTPFGLREAVTSDGGGIEECAVSVANAPRMGDTGFAHGAYLFGVYGDEDGKAVTRQIEYWKYSRRSAPRYNTLAGVRLSEGAQGWPLPAAYGPGVKDGTVLAWRARDISPAFKIGKRSFGPYYSPWSHTCYFREYPKAPPAPALTAAFPQQVAQPVESRISFTITQSRGTPAQEFVWSVDQTPPTAGRIPVAMTCTTRTATAACSKIEHGRARLTIVVPSPGPHDLWVYEVDAGNNESGMTTGTKRGDAGTFTGAEDPSALYNKESTLEGNFAAALGAGRGFDNAMISASAGSAGRADADGHGDALDAGQLRRAGWLPGGTVTVDGAAFRLPDFGGGRTDNLLAANQTLGTGPSGARGSALLFLAASTNGTAQVGGLVGSGSPDSGLLAGDPTVPSVPPGVAVTGLGCTGLMVFDTNDSCFPAQGSIGYASGCPDGRSVPYVLTVPDWRSGLSDIAAVSLPGLDYPGRQGLRAERADLYVFAVPVDAACTVTSVRLPDVAPRVLAGLTPPGRDGGVSMALPALHVLAMAMRNTTTATPQADGTITAAPAGEGWTGAFESPIENAYRPPAARRWGDQTVRIVLSPDVGVPAGDQVRIRLSDPGPWSGDGTGPLVIGASSIAPQAITGGPSPGATPAVLKFGGGSGPVTIAAGGDVYSDPLTLPFPVTAGQDLVVSVWLANRSLPVLPVNSQSAGAMAWFAAAGTGNLTTAATGAPFTGSGGYAIQAVPVLTGLDVTTIPARQDGPASPGEPTVVVAGDNVIDGCCTAVPSDAMDAPSQRLAGQLVSQHLAAGFGVVDAGVPSNMVDGYDLAPGRSPAGTSLLARVDRDILAEPGVGTVIIDEGLEDVLHNESPGTVTVLNDAYQVLSSQLSQFGVANVIFGTLTPCGGYADSRVGDSCTPAVDSRRGDVNSDLSSIAGAGSCVANFAGAVTGGRGSPERLARGDDAGDHVNLTLGGRGGYAAIARTLPALPCVLAAVAYPRPWQPPPGGQPGSAAFGRGM
jgi:hypothetical protein